MFSRDRHLIKESGLFDPVYYLLTYPDVRIADMDPLTHFLKAGGKEGRNPSANFDAQSYLRDHPEVRDMGVNPLIHYLRSSEAKAALGSSGNRASNLLTISNFRHALQFIKVFGLRVFFSKVKNKLFNRQRHELFSVDQPIQVQNILPRKNYESYSEDVLETFAIKVSVVIPVLNAGNDFPLLIKNYVTQKGFEEIEIVIVDSGSTDNTVQIARDYGAVVVQIKPEEFTHSYARNLGGETATGDYLFFTVQDALPPNQTFFLDLYQTLVANEVSAVSCAETPREDADLFFKQICWNHYNFLGVGNGDRITSLPDKCDHQSLRQNGQLADLANFLPKDIFDQYKFRLNYAEDLDLGIRLIKDGHKLAFLGSTRIIHSHNRPSWYFLKRGYVDNIFLTDVFPDFEIPHLFMRDFASDIAYTYNFLGRFINKLTQLPSGATPEDFEAVLQIMASSISVYQFPANISAPQEDYLDYKSTEFILNLITTEGIHKAGAKYDGFLVYAYSGYLHITSNYLKNTYETIDEKLMLDIKNCLCKAFAIVVGAHLAYCYLNRNGQESTNMDTQHKTLMEGV